MGTAILQLFAHAFDVQPLRDGQSELLLHAWVEKRPEVGGLCDQPEGTWGKPWGACQGDDSLAIGDTSCGVLSDCFQLDTEDPLDGSVWPIFIFVLKFT